MDWQEHREKVLLEGKVEVEGLHSQVSMGRVDGASDQLDDRGKADGRI